MSWSCYSLCQETCVCLKKSWLPSSIFGSPSTSTDPFNHKRIRKNWFQGPENITEYATAGFKKILFTEEIFPLKQVKDQKGSSEFGSQFDLRMLPQFRNVISRLKAPSRRSTSIRLLNWWVWTIQTTAHFLISATRQLHHPWWSERGVGLPHITRISAITQVTKLSWTSRLYMSRFYPLLCLSVWQ